MEDPCACAAKADDRQTLLELRRKGVPWGRAQYQAAINQNADLLEWLYSRGCPEHKDTLEALLNMLRDRYTPEVVSCIRIVTERRCQSRDWLANEVTNSPYLIRGGRRRRTLY